MGSFSFRSPKPSLSSPAQSVQTRLTGHRLIVHIVFGNQGSQVFSLAAHQRCLVSLPQFFDGIHLLLLFRRELLIHIHRFGEDAWCSNPDQKKYRDEFCQEHNLLIDHDNLL
jgi:hypothetical protein